MSIDPHQPAPPDAGRRYHAFDALRGGAMSLGVVIHAAVAYMIVPIPGLIWPVHDESRSRAVDWAFWWIHGFRIPLFFVVAGFFSVMLYNSRGAGGYLRHRTKRILLPLLLASAFVLPAVVAVWSWGWIDAGIYTWDQIRHLQFAGEVEQDGVTGLAHLWFLEYLYLYCVALCLWKIGPALLFGRDRGGGALHRVAVALFSSSFRPALFCLPSVAILGWDERVITHFQNDFLPSAPGFIYYFWFFLAGTWMHAARHTLDRLKRPGGLYILLTVPVGAGMILSIERGTATPDMVPTWLLAVAVALFCWLNIFGWIGVALRFFDSPRPIARWLSDSAYWVYLVHLPVVGAIHILLRHVHTPALGKLLLTVAGAYSVCLVSYQLIVRHSWIGRLLNGSRAGEHHGSKSSS